MTDPNDKIETGVDKLLALIKSRQKLSISDAAQELNVHKTIVEHWADALDEKGLIKVKLTLKNKFLMDKDYYHKSSRFFGGHSKKQKLTAALDLLLEILLIVGMWQKVLFKHYITVLKENL